MLETMLDSIASDPNAGVPDPGKPADLIVKLLPYIFGVAGIVLLINIVSSGLKMMTSRGDPKALQAAQAKLTTSVLGIVILFSSFFVVRLVMQFLGINTVLFN